MRRSEGVGEEKDLRFFPPWRLDASVFHKVARSLSKRQASEVSFLQLYVIIEAITISVL